MHSCSLSKMKQNKRQTEKGQRHDEIHQKEDKRRDSVHAVFRFNNKPSSGNTKYKRAMRDINTGSGTKAIEIRIALCAACVRFKNSSLNKNLKACLNKN